MKKLDELRTYLDRQQRMSNLDHELLHSVGAPDGPHLIHLRASTLIYLLRVADAGREVVDFWEDSGDGTYQHDKFENAMLALESLVLEEEA